MNAIATIQLHASYNQLMNQRLYHAASQLSPEQLSADKGAFFGSVLGTLNHIVVGDTIWLQRFATHPHCQHALAKINEEPRPARLDSLLYDDLAALTTARERIDAIILNWVATLDNDTLATPLRYRNMAGDPFCKPFGGLITHLFLHQIHHRGQVTTLLSQEGIDFGDTDLIEFIDDIAP